MPFWSRIAIVIFYVNFPWRHRIFPSFSGICPEEKIRQIRGKSPVVSPAILAAWARPVLLQTDPIRRLPDTWLCLRLWGRHCWVSPTLFAPLRLSCRLNGFLPTPIQQVRSIWEPDNLKGQSESQYCKMHYNVVTMENNILVIYTIFNNGLQWKKLLYIL